MEHFTSVHDVADIRSLIHTAMEIKDDPRASRLLGKGKVLGLIFMNPSLRTRLSTQKAAMNLGVETMVMNFTGEGWALETGEGVVMDGDKAEHIREATAVIGRYCDIIGIRSFPGLKDREADYRDEVLQQFMRFSGRHVISLESATRHPLQSLADMITIEEKKKTERPKVVLSWAPHPRALPQSVPNSFLEWARLMDYELMVTHPEGAELAPEFSDGISVEYDQQKAFQDADFIYVKNWSSYHDYGKVISPKENWTINLDKIGAGSGAKVMHCLPVRRNVVISDDVLDSDHSIVLDEAENRVYAAQAVLMEFLTGMAI